MKEQITQKIIETIAEIKNDHTLLGSADSSTNFALEIGLDSLQMINLFLTIEEEYDIEFNFDEFDYNRINTIDKLSVFIESLMVKVF